MRNAKYRDNQKAAQGKEQDQLSTWDYRAAIDEVLDGYQSFTMEMLIDFFRSQASAE